MARLTVRLHGETVTQIKLESGNEYYAGRAQDAHIRLDQGKGISRQHLKLYERDGVWVCESLSKFTQIQRGGESLDVIELNETAVFVVPPYEFLFETSASASASQPAAESEAPRSANLPAFYNPRIQSGGGAHAQAPDSGGVSEHTTPRANNDATVAGAANLVPYFRISYPNTADDEVLKLEGQLWVAGRDSDCEIPIDSPHVSRKHFELVKTAQGYFITDLGSSNGTKLNGIKIPPHEPTKLESGDEIKVMNVSMSFEIRDTAFANRVDNLPVPPFDPMFGAGPMMPEPWYQNNPAQYAQTELRHSAGGDLPSRWQDYRPHHLKKVDWKKNKVRVVLVVLVGLMVVMSVLPDKKKEDKPRDPAASGPQSPTFENLTKEQQASVKDTFGLARNLYVQGKYALCLTELAKLHELVPQFENSRELQSFCEQGLVLVEKNNEIERRKKEAEMIEQQITGYVETCKAKLSATATVDETRTCLADAMIVAPEHQLITEMIHAAQLREQEQQFNENLKREEAAKVAKGNAHFQRAMGVYKQGKLSVAITELEKFLNTTYPRQEGNKSEARRTIASIKKELKSKVDSLLEQCRALGKQSKYKEAYVACDQAVSEDPGNSEAKTIRKEMHAKLRKEMKSIYEDSVLEENMGNVDTAKEKWKKILQENLDFDEYTKKAKSKLEKYEGI